MPSSPRKFASWLTGYSVLAFSSVLTALPGFSTECQAQAAKPSKKMIVGFGLSADLTEPARNGLDLVLLPGEDSLRPTMVTSLRFGKYVPDGLLGSARAEADGFPPGKRPNFASVYFGVQAPAPFLRPSLGFYGRVSGGLTMYSGQAFRDIEPGQGPESIQRSVGPRLAPGIEVSIGGRNPSSGDGFGFRSELRLGFEHVARAGFKMIRPTVVIGGDFPIRFR